MINKTILFAIKSSPIVKAAIAIAACLLILTNSAFSQQFIELGVLNDKTISLPKPVYPATAAKA